MQLTPQPLASQELSPMGLFTVTDRDPRGCHVQTVGKKDPPQINNTRRGLAYPEAKRHITEMPRAGWRLTQYQP